MNRLTITCFAFFFLVTAFAQQLEVAPIAENVSHVAVDRVAQLYIQYEDGSLEKRDAASGSSYIFRDGLLGDISQIDVSDPFGTLLYFEEYQTLLLLDRTLNEVARVDLRNLDQVQQPTVFVRHFNDQLWLYDSWDNRLKLIDQNGRIILQSDNLRQLLDREESPHSLWVQNNTLFALWPDGSLVTFSFWGQLLSRQSLPTAEGFAWMTNGLIGWNKEKAWLWTGKATKAIPVSEEQFPFDFLLNWEEGYLILKNKKLFYLK